MSILALGIIFLVTVIVTVGGGVRAVFAYVYLPAMLLFAHIPQFSIPLLPDVGTEGAVGYGLIVGLLLKGGEPLGLTFHWLDGLVLLLGSLMILTATTTEFVWTGINAFGTHLFGWVLPYFLGRVAISDARTRKAALNVIIACSGAIAFLALVEFRLWPLIFSRTLERFGVGTSYKMVLARFGFFRAQVSFDHPIDLGNGGVLLGCLIVLLALTTGRGFRDLYVRLALAACAVMVVCSGSFTCYLAGAAAVLIFAGLYYGKRFAAGLLVPGVAALVALGLAATSYLLVFDLGQGPDPDNALSGSLWVRALIVQNAWALAQHAGYFGFGRLVSQKELDLESVDNAYMLLLLRYGWVYLICWIGMFFGIAAIATRALRNARTDAERLPIAAAATGLLAMGIAMYTVWFGFVYATLFTMMMGMTVTMSQMLAASRRGPLRALPLTAAQRFRIQRAAAQLPQAAEQVPEHLPAQV